MRKFEIYFDSKCANVSHFSIHVAVSRDEFKWDFFNSALYGLTKAEL